MVERRGRTRFAPETLQYLWVSGNIIREELERNKPAELGVLGLVNDAHTAATELFDNAVARNSLPDHLRESYVWGTDQVNERRGDSRDLCG